jgi:hypothetical protein
MIASSTPSNQRVYHGVDFSGAKHHRGKIWVSTWNGKDPATTRNGFSHAELVGAIAGSAGDGCRHYWLIDAPFNLSVQQLETQGIECNWRATLDWLASFDSARDWRRACRKVSRVEPRRAVDIRAHTPFAPINLRMFKQTWHCMVSLLLPLVDDDRVAILPMGLAGAEQDRMESARVRIGESCPSSVLRRLGWPHTGYKGIAPKNKQAREDLLRRLEREAGISVTEGVRDTAIVDTEGDALDSLLILASASRFAKSDHAKILQDDSLARVEGWVYL